MNTLHEYSFMYKIEPEDFYKDNAQDLGTRFGTIRYSQYDNRILPIGENLRVIGMMVEKLGGKIICKTVCNFEN